LAPILPSLPPVSSPTRGLTSKTKFCGFDYQHAATQCSQPCRSGFSYECPAEMSCYSQTPCAEWQLHRFQIPAPTKNPYNT
jgi:hypothetical protein